MGFFSKLFGGSPDYPELDPTAPAADRIHQVEGALQSLAEQTHDRLEVVPGGDKAFVFVGKPPKQFGLAWIEDGQVRNLKAYMDDHHIDKQKAGKLVDALTQAYRRNADAPRYTAEMKGHTYVVTPSDKLASDVERVLERGAQA